MTVRLRPPATLPVQLSRVYLDLDALPQGKIQYASRAYVARRLPPFILRLIDQMAIGIAEPRITYHKGWLDTGTTFTHTHWHCDGKQCEGEIHRLLTLGGPATLGYPDIVLSPGFIWQYDGFFFHRAQAPAEICQRLVLRVSQTEMRFRDWG